jgi:CBS domain-containing protein
VLVKNMMTRKATTVGPDFPLATAARLMRDGEIGCLLVVDHERVVGVLTDRDIVVRGVADALDPVYSVVREAMSASAIVCSVDDAVHQARRLMTANRIKQLPVLDRENRLVGLVSIGDIAARSGEPVEDPDVNLDQAELPADDQAVDGHALEPAPAARGQPTFLPTGQDIGHLNSAHRGSSAPGRSRAHGENRESWPCSRISPGRSRSSCRSRAE